MIAAVLNENFINPVSMLNFKNRYHAELSSITSISQFLTLYDGEWKEFSSKRNPGNYFSFRLADDSPGIAYVDEEYFVLLYSVRYTRRAEVVNMLAVVDRVNIRHDVIFNSEMLLNIGKSRAAFITAVKYIKSIKEPNKIQDKLYSEDFKRYRRFP